MALKGKASVFITIVLMHLGKYYVSSVITDVRLVGGPAPNKGTVEIKLNGTWETTCGVNLGISDVIVICRQLGFPGANGAVANTPYIQRSNPTSGLLCTSDEHDLSECKLFSTPLCLTAGSATCHGDGYLGCFVDNANVRVLAGDNSIADPDMTISYCVKFCTDSIAADYTYAGVENGDECFCGVASTNYSRLGMEWDANCQDPCSGDSTERCGGQGYIAIYDLLFLEGNECLAGTDNCGANATCINTPGSFTCVCNAKYVGDGFTCTDNNECTAGTDNCHLNAACTNTLGSFVCTCNAGYIGDGTSCNDEDECNVGTDNCDTYAACINTPGSFTCACNPGFTGDGIRCIDNDECIAGTDNCDINATCTNIIGSFTCTCHAGYIGDGTSCTDPVAPTDDADKIAIGVGAAIAVVILIAVGMVIFKLRKPSPAPHPVNPTDETNTPVPLAQDSTMRSHTYTEILTDSQGEEKPGIYTTNHLEPEQHIYLEPIDPSDTGYENLIPITHDSQVVGRSAGGRGDTGEMADTLTCKDGVGAANSSEVNQGEPFSIAGKGTTATSKPSESQYENSALKVIRSFQN